MCVAAAGEAQQIEATVAHDAAIEETLPLHSPERSVCGSVEFLALTIFLFFLFWAP